jgi:hypothetical protein
MNPQFARSKADKNAIRSEYIKNLQLETSNNLMNYNANQIFKQTGALPPSITAQLDTRSITEKYADKQKARVAVIAGLREITDGANANMISDQIHGDEIITLLNNLPQIVADIKPKWSLGITAPAFMDYWNKYKLSLQANAGVSNFPILQSNQLLTSINGALQNIQATIPTKEDLIRLKSVMGDLPSTRLRQQAIEEILRALKFEEIIQSGLKDIQTEDQPEIIEQKRNLLAEMATKFPNREQIGKAINDFEIAQSLGRDRQGIERLEGELIQSLGQIPRTAELQQINDLMLVKKGINEIEKKTPKTTPTQSQEEDEAERLRTIALNSPYPVPLPQFLQSSAIEQGSESEGENEEEGMTTAPADTPRSLPSRQTYQGEIPTTYEQFENMGTWIKKRDFIKQLYNSDKQFHDAVNWGSIPPNKKSIQHLAESEYSTKGTKIGEKSKFWIGLTNIPELLQEYFKQKPAGGLGGAEESKQSETGKGLRRKRQMKGCGVSFAPKGSISTYARVDTSKKVEKVPSYIQFGKHLLHQHDLHGGILKIKRLSGSIINDLPTQSIGGKLKKVLITLTGTGSPSFEDINELNEHEKSLLNKIVKNCKIDQRLLVPTPDKTKEEQLYNRLQILSGEINAGNNNPQIVRELKTLLLKLKNSGRIPARHAHVILEELLSLGY